MTEISQYCPACDQNIKDSQFKTHLYDEWIKRRKKNEEFPDFIRRIFGSKVKIQFELLEG